jgi:hypothetical protein
MKLKYIRWTWTNWTFGIWWGLISRKKHLGIDCGPFEVTWVEK